MAKAKQPFQVGDKVTVRNGSGPVLTVSWISKKSATRADQLIATETNDHGHTCSDASLYELAQ